MPPWPFPAPPLRNSEIALRPWRSEDAVEKATAWGSDAEIVRWTAVPADYTPEAARAFVERIENERLAGRALDLAVFDSQSDAILGSVGLRTPTDDPLIGELGYLVAPEARGRGVATRAVGLLSAWAFEELGMARIQALVHPDNPASGRVVERLGFKPEGLLRAYRQKDGRGGSREDRISYSLLRGEVIHNQMVRREP